MELEVIKYSKSQGEIHYTLRETHSSMRGMKETTIELKVTLSFTDHDVYIN